MDEQTKQHALDKLDSMSFRIGFPDEILDNKLVSLYYETVWVKKGNFIKILIVDN